jgi:hypothetical protein
MRQFSLFVLVVGLGVGLGGCRDTDKKDNMMTPDAKPDDVSIYDIQNDAMPECDPAVPATCVAFSVRGVIVTAIDAYGSRTGDFWVQEPDGGPFSGVRVYGAPVAQVAALAIGDVVDITGVVKDEFACEPCAQPDTSGRSLTELKPAPGGMITVTKKASGPAPDPVVVDALAIGMMDQAGRDVEWEKWEGVLIKVNNVTQTGAMRMGSEPDRYDFRITGGVVVQSVMTPLPSNTARNDCYASITGVGDYFFNWLLLPRTAEDIETSGTGCPPPESVCDDGIDNDGNGFTDCADFSCQPTVACAGQPTNATIADVQVGDATGRVILEEVYVTALTFNRRNLWVQQSLTSAPNEGIYVFRGASASQLDATEYAPGTKVRVVGTVQESNNDNTGTTLTQLGAGPELTRLEDATAAPTPVTGQAASSLVVEATGEPYESVLVTLTNVKISVAGTNASFYVGELDQGGTKFFSDDDVYRLTDPVDTCYASITGIWTYSVFSNTYGLLPTVAPVSGGTCQ